MKSVHFILQGKGGVGKSLIASILTQYFMAKSENIYCADTDSVNDTFARYNAFSAHRINILNQDKNIDVRIFDQLIEQILGHNGTAIIDNGSSTFVPLSAYMTENGVLDLLSEAGKEVYIHTVLTGGQAMEDTMIGLNILLSTQDIAKIVVWENEYFGEVTKDGKHFHESAMFKNNKDRIKGIIKIHRRNPDTFGKDLEIMVRDKMTFDEAISSDSFGIMPRQRLKMIRTSLFDQIKTAGF